MAEQDAPDQAANREKAEGSREAARDEGPERGSGGGSAREPSQGAAGITNRPIEREQEEQRRVPPRGETRDD